MISALLHASWLALRRDRAALVLTFVLPILFFSIFALVFGSLGEGSVQPVPTLLLADRDDASIRMETVLKDEEIVRLVGVRPLAERAAAIELLRRGRVSTVVVLPPDFDAAMAAALTSAPPVELLVDRAHPVAARLVAGVLQSAALAVLAERLPVQREPGASGAAADPIVAGPLAIGLEDVLGTNGKRPSIAFFAAGLGVMFLLFAVSGRGGALIEEGERGVLTRMLASRLRLTQLLFGRWLYLATLGALQVTLMFVWGALVFDLDLWTPQHLIGFLVMTSVTAGAAAGFGLLLAVSCRSRAQLNGVSIVVVLIMSALGGSMFPRFLMPETLRRIGLATFNAWALDGYQKVFWYEASLWQLWPQISVLAVLGAVFFALSRIVGARALGRWTGAAS